MKDSLFEMLMNFFEKSLAQLKESQTVGVNTDDDESLDNSSLESRTLYLKDAKNKSMRIFIEDEQRKFTKASYQFLTRLILWGIIAQDTMEIIINQLLFSESRFVTLQETKWTIRNTLADNLDANQLAFLDLVLYQKEDKLALH
ncbi:DUF494 family protein [Legionella jamestowniensis]|uniref:Protein Smg n=1 Tax=Legionella jamestowniensis TaxID=455 RepID=A0A0W0UHP8_9GAMM|nr:DUF494 family protein [Legionella jamestowniensis]KTD07370.1 hypothetical protein Ljam_1565 [Legionella jamestowniensis]OCH97855.1 hypothetical protein A8135_01130 [Legionella jamestowniensis]SFL93961.1 Protein of unknown function [Legionella jamestowniensis DSM 19215]